MESRGLNFVAAGRCTAGGAAREEGAKETSRHQGWSACANCKDAKFVAAFENYTEGLEYASEKPWLPEQSGAIAVYDGNGHDLLRSGFNTDRMVQRQAGESDEAFAARFAHLLVDDNGSEARRLHALPSGKPTLDLNPIAEYVSKHPKYEALQSQSEIVVYVVFRHGVYQYGLWGESDALYVGASGRTPVGTGQRHSPTVGTLHCRRARGGRLQRGMVVGAMSQVRCSNETNGDPQRSLSPSFS